MSLVVRRALAACGSRSRLGLVSLTVAVLVSIGPRAAQAHDVLTFERDVRPIVHRACGGDGCHVNEQTSGVELTSFETMISSVGEQYGAPVVAPGNPDASPIMDKINAKAPTFGDPMPLEGERLSDLEINTIRQWIRDGARSRHLTQRGDANLDDNLDIGDPVLTLNYLFRSGAAPACELAADANADGSVSLPDAVFTLGFLFLGGPEPARLTDEEQEVCERAGELSFTDIWEKVLSTSCAFTSCHSTERHKGELSLESLEEAYQQLFEAEPFNEVARSNGMKRVDPGRPENSFLLRKLSGPGPGEGNRMPASSAEPLPPCAIDSIREWILAGAPFDSTVEGVQKTCEVGDISTDELPQPPVPENGVQVHLPPFSIAPRAEREIFYFADRPFADLTTEEVVVQRIDIHMKESSHHFIVYEWLSGTTPRAGLRPVESTVDIINSRRFVLGSQQSFFSLAFPPGVGLRFTRNTRFDLNSHYVNLDGQDTLRGEVYINFFFAEPGTTTTFVKPIFEINPNIEVPPNQTRTTEWVFPGLFGIQQDPALGNVATIGGVVKPTHIYSLSSHMHRHGVRFSAFLTRDGQDVDPPNMIYDNFSWDDPVYSVFDPPLVLQPGEGFRFTTTHTYHDPPSPNAPPLTFDVTSEDEMAILLGYYAIP